MTFLNALMIATAATLLTCPVLAQDTMPEGMTPEQQEQMQQYMNMTPEQQQEMVNQAMKGAQAMQECMDGVGADDAYYDALEKRMQEVDREIETLCAAGDEKEATERAREEMDKLVDDPKMKKMQECSKMMEQHMPEGMKPVGMDPEDYRYKGENICAEIAKEKAEEAEAASDPEAPATGE